MIYRVTGFILNISQIVLDSLLHALPVLPTTITRNYYLMWFYEKTTWEISKLGRLLDVLPYFKTDFWQCTAKKCNRHFELNLNIFLLVWSCLVVPSLFKYIYNMFLAHPPFSYLCRNVAFSWAWNWTSFGFALMPSKWWHVTFKFQVIEPPSLAL